MISYFLRLFFLLFGFAMPLAFAAPQSVRWTGAQDKNADLNHIVGVLKAKTGIALAPEHFLLIENKPLARSHFRMYAQLAGAVPMKGMSLRLWTTPEETEAIQVEAQLDTPPPPEILKAFFMGPPISSEQTMAWVRQVVGRHLDDPRLTRVEWRDEWSQGRLVRSVTARGRYGTHFLEFDLMTGQLLSADYRPFPDAGGEFSLPVEVYPIYEEVEGTQNQLLPRIQSELKYIASAVPKAEGDLYAPLKTRRYREDKLDPILALTAQGQKDGFWAMALVRLEAQRLLAAAPTTANSFCCGQGVVLEGRYATINLHPDVVTAFTGLSFMPAPSPFFKPDWKPTPEDPAVWEMIPGSGLRGKPILTADEPLKRPARRLSDHNTKTYINDGFDELQVYWSINQMFESLQAMGFTDPELSTRKFHAFLYDPNIEYRNNAYYTEDTINFTTYTGDALNYARDNTTIWHELGHGVMDRLMGDYIRLADTGGLSEGMADFVAQMVLNDVTQGQSFPGQANLRILNKTGFHLTNESHDDGEAYGGSMNDMLVAAMTTYGHKPGLAKVTDLTLEAMRYSRNHPALTANGWFEHMLFADELGNPPLRQPGELRPIILKALSGRNFNLDGSPVASFGFRHQGMEVIGNAPGTRYNPIRINLKSGETTKHVIAVELKGSATYSFRYPVTVKVQLRGGPIQGAAHWTAEEAGTVSYILAAEGAPLEIPLEATGCDEFNRPDKSCVDFAYVQIWNQGDTDKPVAKKRFYLRIYPEGV